MRGIFYYQCMLRHTQIPLRTRLIRSIITRMLHDEIVDGTVKQKNNLMMTILSIIRIFTKNNYVDKPFWFYVKPKYRR